MTVEVERECPEGEVTEAGVVLDVVPGLIGDIIIKWRGLVSGDIDLHTEHETVIREASEAAQRMTWVLGVRHRFVGYVGRWVYGWPGVPDGELE